MSVKSKTVHVVELNANAQNLSKALGDLRKDFQGMTVPPELEKVFTKLENSINSILRKTQDGIVSREVFIESEKEIGKIKTAFEGLYSTMNGFKTISDKKLFAMLPEDTKQKIDEINKAYTSYEQSLKDVLKAEQAVISAQQKKSEATAKADAAERSRAAYQGVLTKAEKEFKKYNDVTEALKEQTEAAEELKKAEKELAEAQRSGKTDKVITNKKAKVDVAKERKTKADSVVSEIDPKRLNAQQAAIKKVTTAEENYTAAKKDAQAASRAKTQAEALEANAADQLQKAREAATLESEKEASALNRVKKALATINPAYADLRLEGETTEDQLQNLRKVIDDLSEDELNKLRTSLNNASDNYDKFQDKNNELKKALEQVKEETRAADEALGQQQALENKIKSFLGLSGAAQVLRHALRDAMQTITELDATMTEMAVVTDLTVGDYWDQLPEYSKRASELGVSVNSAYEAATLYYQQGLKTNEVNAISTQTLKMAKIAGLDAASATDKMTAALRGFNMELNEASAQRVADVYSQLAAITAADTKEIANAMTKTASIASSAGMEFETTAAFLAQIVETTRESAETAGTAMKTVIARFQELKKAPDEIGEVDGEIVDANAIETALRSVGVSLRDTNGQFRDLDDVFLELSRKWDSLDKNTQRYIATIAAGSRQQSRFIAMMSDYGRTQELVTAANNSAGASQKQFEKTMESLSAKVEKLKNAWHEFTMGIMNSDLVKAGIDILTKFLEIINKATSSFGSLGNSISKIATVLVVFKMGQKIFEKLKAPLVSFFAEIVSEARKTGEKAGDAAKEGLEKSKNKQNKTESKEQTNKEKKIKTIQTSIANKAQWEANGGGGKTIRGEISKLPQKINKQQIKDSVNNIKNKVTAPIQDAKQAKSLKQEIGNDKISLAVNQSLGNVATSEGLKDRIQQNEGALKEVQDRQDQRVQTIKNTASNVVNKTGEFLMGDSLASAKQNHTQMQESGKKIAELPGQIQEKSQDIVQQKDNLNNLQNKKGGINDLKAQKIQLEAIAKSEKASAKEREKAKNSLSRLNQNLMKQEKEYAKAEAELAKSEEEYANLNESFNEESEKYLNAQEGMWDDIGKGISSAGEKIAGVGVAASMLGGIFQEMGLEGLGETFSTVGQFATIFGTALTVLGPIISVVGKIGTSVAGELTAAGWSTQAAWWWVALIALAIMALVAGVIAIFSAIKNNSPEKKLQEAQQNAEAAAKAADEARESFEGLTEALQALEDKYKALEDLTEGTDEWNNAIQDVNASVLELIDKYPELAGLVENKGGVLTLDVDSEEVKAVINDYEKTAVMAKGAELGAKAKLKKQEAAYNIMQLDNKVFDSFVTDRGAAVGIAAGNLLAATATGAAGGAGIGAAIGAKVGAAGGTVVAPGVGSVTGAAAGAGGGAIIGSIAGGIAGLTAGIATFQYTMDQVEKNDEQNRENVKELAQAYANGETGTTVEEIAEYVERNGYAVGDAAEQMAKTIVEESEQMLALGNSLNGMDSAQKAYYQAMATNAQQLIDLGKYTQQEMSQMSTVVDSDLVKIYEDKAKEEMKDMSKSEMNKAKEDFAKQQYGDNVKVKGNKIVDETGETIREFTDNEAWITEMAAANATLQAAESMEKIPGIIDKNMKKTAELVGVAAQNALEKAFSGEDLTKGELDEMEKVMGKGTYTYTDADGTEHSGVSADEAWEGLGASGQAAWDSKEAFIKSLDKDYENIDKMWEELDSSEKAVYGLTKKEGEEGYEEELEKAKEAYEKTFTDVYNKQQKDFQSAENNKNKILGESAKLSEKLTSSVAKAWTEKLVEIAPSGNDVNALNDSLTNMLAGLTDEQASLVMQQINSIDQMDISAWEELEYVFKDLGVNIPTDKLRAFTEAGIAASGAIEKIDFANFHKEINNTHILLKKIKEGGRSYSEDDYKLLVASNSELKDKFMQVGEDFLYVGGSMDELKEAVKENTVALLQEANRQLGSRTRMSAIIKEQNEASGSITAMDEYGLREYLLKTREAIAASGDKITDFGIAGLSENTDFLSATKEQLLAWAQALSVEGESGNTYAENYAKGLRNANIQAYAQNDAAYNAEMALERNGGEYADEHSEALILQAVQAGSATDEMIEAYRDAVESGDQDLIEELGSKIAEATDRIIEGSEGRDAYSELIDRVADALEAQSQKEIDKLSEVNDSINSANANLLNKIQQQIDEQRQARENEKAMANISNMHSQAAYLGMDTSGANALELTSLNEQIEEEELSMQDQLIDQYLQSLSDANERAAEQREQQIALAQMQLENQVESGELLLEAQNIVAESLDQLRNGTAIDATTMGELLYDNEAENLNALAQESWWSDVIIKTTQAANYSDGGSDNISGNQGGDTGPGSASGNEEKTKEQLRTNAINKAKTALFSNDAGGFSNSSGNSTYQDALKDFTAAGGGDEAAFKAAISNTYNSAEEVSGTFPGGATITGVNPNNWYGKLDQYDGNVAIQLKGQSKVTGLKIDMHATGDRNGIYQLSGKSPEQNWLALYKGEPYIYSKGEWRPFKSGSERTSLRNAMTESLVGKKFKTGGLADFTGPAWLDGTKSKPEIVLNQRDSANFMVLRDILGEVLDGKKGTSEKISSGDNYFDIEINVEKLENDYDIEKIANKIRRMIYEDATYRNVNAVTM